MAREFSKAFYNSAVWRRCREAFVQSRFGLCEKCGMPGDDVHHKIVLNPTNINDPSVTLNWENLELLCDACHNRAHGMGSTAQGIEFDEEGNVVPTPPYHN
jgi:5-methylcytosine-specific restriction protein A